MGEREGALIRVKGFGEGYLRRKRRQRQASSVSQPFCVKTIHSIYHNWCVGERGVTSSQWQRRGMNSVTSENGITSRASSNSLSGERQQREEVTHQHTASHCNTSILLCTMTSLYLQQKSGAVKSSTNETWYNYYKVKSYKPID